MTTWTVAVGTSFEAWVRGSGKGCGEGCGHLRLPCRLGVGCIPVGLLSTT